LRLPAVVRPVDRHASLGQAVLDPAADQPVVLDLLHWLLTIALIGNLVIGWLLDDSEELLALHKSIGIAILGLALVRFANRLRVRCRLPPSTNAAGTPAYLAEKTVHHLLYVLMFAIPLLGWLKTNAAGHVTNCFGLFSLPTLVPKSHEPPGPTRALRPAQ